MGPAGTTQYWCVTLIICVCVCVCVSWQLWVRYWVDTLCTAVDAALL